MSPFTAIARDSPFQDLKATQQPRTPDLPGFYCFSKSSNFITVQKGFPSTARQTR